MYDNTRNYRIFRFVECFVMANLKTTSFKNHHKFRHQMFKVIGGRKRHIVNINSKLYMMPRSHL